MTNQPLLESHGLHWQPLQSHRVQLASWRAAVPYLQHLVRGYQAPRHSYSSQSALSKLRDLHRFRDEHVWDAGYGYDYAFLAASSLLAQPLAKAFR